MTLLNTGCSERKPNSIDSGMTLLRLNEDGRLEVA